MPAEYTSAAHTSHLDTLTVGCKQSTLETPSQSVAAWGRHKRLGARSAAAAAKCSAHRFSATSGTPTLMAMAIVLLLFLV